MMKKQKFLVAVIAFASACFILSSCGNGENDGEKREEIKDTMDAGQISKDIEEEGITYSLPSPAQIAAIFKKSGLKFYPGITNPAENSNKYLTAGTLVKALNLGVYGADLSYCVLNKQTQDGKNYFKICRQLAGDLGFSGAFESGGVHERLEKNMGNEDTVLHILSQIQSQTDNILENNDKSYISVISFTGAWIESVYIGSQVYLKEKNNDNIATKLVEQMSIAQNIVKALKANQDKDAGIAGLISDIQSIDDIYNNFPSIREIKASDPDVIDPAKVHLTIEDIQTFTKKVEEIRHRFTN